MAQLKDTTVTGDLSVSCTVNGQDIRFYAKALTQAEVTELYQTRLVVDKDSNKIKTIIRKNNIKK